MSARPAAVAGSFYPADQAHLRAAVDELLETNPCTSARVPKAIVVPHAGYIYSGSTAASVYNLLKPASRSITRVVMLGPAHRVRLAGMALSDSDKFITPFGEIAIDTELQNNVIKLSNLSVSEHAHAFEHSLEVQLPFLQTVLESFKLLPVVVGDASADEVATLVDRVWGQDETVIVVSTDLSHFRSYESATKFDKSTCAAILNYDTSLNGEQACGCFPLNGMLKIAVKRKMHIDLIDYRNSGDTAGSRDRVVGYGAFALYEN